MCVCAIKKIQMFNPLPYQHNKSIINTQTVKKKMTNLEKVDEEFSNFLYKVNQVSSIVEKLTSNDTKLQQIGDLEAKKYLGEEKNLEIVNEEEIELKIQSNRTVINKKAIEKDDNPNTQSQDAFMAEISKDADRRYKDKQIRREKMETLKKQGNNAFRRGEYEKALSLYNKGIEYIKDSPLMYQNRALTYIQLKLYEKAIIDLELALRLNETSLKTWLLLIKCHFLNRDMNSFRENINEAKNKLPGYEQDINGFVQELTM